MSDPMRQLRSMLTVIAFVAVIPLAMFTWGYTTGCSAASSNEREGLCALHSQPTVSVATAYHAAPSARSVDGAYYPGDTLIVRAFDYAGNIGHEQYVCVVIRVLQPGDKQFGLK